MPASERPYLWRRLGLPSPHPRVLRVVVSTSTCRPGASVSPGSKVKVNSPCELWMLFPTPVLNTNGAVGVGASIPAHSFAAKRISSRITS